VVVPGSRGGGRRANGKGKDGGAEVVCFWPKTFEERMEERARWTIPAVKDLRTPAARYYDPKPSTELSPKRIASEGGEKKRKKGASSRKKSILAIG